MLNSNDMCKIVKVFIIAVLCSEMQPMLTDQGSNTQHLGAAHDDVDYGVNGSDRSTTATPYSAKYHVSIRLAAQENRFGEGHLCSGALIAPAVVLTVAHCIFDYKRNAPRHPSELQVVLGNSNRYQSSTATLVYGVTHLYKPNTFEPFTLRDNIAIVMLDRDIPAEHMTVQSIAWNSLSPKNVSESAREEGERELRITSWGSNLEGLPIARLMSLNASKLEEKTCSRAYGGFFSIGMHCIGMQDHNMTSCPQDAGAPLLDHNQLVGLASFGYGCAAKDYPTFYTNVSHHKEWILGLIGDGTHKNGSIWGTAGLLLFTAYAIKRSNFVKFH